MENKELYTISDLVDGTDMLHICKRLNNSKRDYLFVNKYQGKHVPVSPLDVFERVKELYDKSYIYLCDKKKILVIGFAETATAIGEIFYGYCLNDEKSVDAIEYVHTTREKSNCKKLIEFQEEHSHATEQNLYTDKESLDFDTIVFVEDEITTGNTILNFINEFNKIKKVDSYFVVSFANWQTEEWKNKFKENNVKAISLVSGTLKKDLAPLNMEPKNALNISSDLCNVTFNIHEWSIPVDKANVGISREEYNSLLDYGFKNYQSLLTYLDKDDTIEVVGTEEYMFFPLYIASSLKELGYDTYYHATTRSPIMISENCIIKDGVQIPSAYDEKRINYLYNLDRGYNKVFIFCKDTINYIFMYKMISIYLHYGVDMKNIHFIIVKTHN